MKRAMRWLLMAVVGFFALVGFQYVTRVTSVQQVRAVGADGRPLTPIEPLFPTKGARRMTPFCRQASVSMSGNPRRCTRRPSLSTAWATIGSISFDDRSLALNDEATLMILDAGTGGQINAIYASDLHYATEITAARFRRRPWSQRLVEGIAGLLSPLL